MGLKLILALMLCCPVNPVCVWHGVKAVGHGIGHASKTAFYATTNFFVDHVQPNQTGEPGKVCKEHNGSHN